MTVPGASLLDDEDEDEDVDRDLELSDLDEWDSDNEERPRLDGIAKSVLLIRILISSLAAATRNPEIYRKKRERIAPQM